MIKVRVEVQVKISLAHLMLTEQKITSNDVNCFILLSMDVTKFLEKIIHKSILIFSSY